eukprot:CAMPEP_0115714644 /NCGR_PEP_ID=MMETSP0272-20121206/75350_1 /TAXON_ID=71861 /ORGANISM="Scrippsiella trochoidea, Strain CCMP3099" /LENGTH=42 /DNA_ID= /DNA_START= /DNA_END= /DNA_ORIENTATION=
MMALAMMSLAETASPWSLEAASKLKPMPTMPTGASTDCGAML